MYTLMFTIVNICLHMWSVFFLLMGVVVRSLSYVSICGEDLGGKYAGCKPPAYSLFPYMRRLYVC